MLYQQNYFMTMYNTLEHLESIELIQNGKIHKLSQQEFQQTFARLQDLFGEARVMPAFGVSIHEETVNAIQDGEWLKLNYNAEMDKEGLLFTSLLFRLEECQGFNLIRLYGERYDGRCIYLDLPQTTDLKQLIK
ncbi:MAG: hypothetical protein IJA22_03670 [Clostridia bacterium]|nr:hypothetical protein [Clostridia bacterium]